MQIQTAKTDENNGIVDCSVADVRNPQNTMGANIRLMIGPVSGDNSNLLLFVEWRYKRTTVRQINDSNHSSSEL